MPHACGTGRNDPQDPIRQHYAAIQHQQEWEHYRLDRTPCRKDEEYAYPDDWKKWVHDKFSKMEFDDYDYLICLCDKFFEGMLKVSMERRVEGIVKRYGLTEKQKKTLLKNSLSLKHYFDKKTGTDIYKILDIKD